MSLDEIEKIMSKYGEYKRYERKHKRFKADNGREYLRDFTIEYIHCLKKTSGTPTENGGN
jgi:adenine-specific DNA-methyltransferase